MKKRKLLFLIPLGIVAILAFIGIGGVLVMQLWNWLLPSIFGWREITFWQAVGLLALCRILFGGFGSHRSGGAGRWKFRRRFNERLAQLTPEERERFRQVVNGGCEPV